MQNRYYQSKWICTDEATCPSFSRYYNTKSFLWQTVALAIVIQRQKEFELAEFKMLHSEEGGERDQGGDRWNKSLFPLFQSTDWCSGTAWLLLGSELGRLGFVEGLKSHQGLCWICIFNIWLFLNCSDQSTTEALWFSVLMAWRSGPILTISSSLRISGPCEQHTFSIFNQTEFIASA